MGTDTSHETAVYILQTQGKILLTALLKAEENALLGRWYKGRKKKKKCLGLSKTEILITPVRRKNLKFHKQP